ncbi:uncharacterized protein LOC113277970 [Papaver somniferum]|uniref:uncharacterized protein LOC113277970 n=1 Tax=Papaver somniferum TaxID=3469 RepID=UPI000E6FF9AA|nr:uncharacterized protein LOC113277970 [Papaver somniferum]
MAEEPVVNPCCSVWKFQYTEVVAKRNALREAVKLLNAHINKIQAENLSISKALEEERARVEAEKQAKVKESGVRVELENEILQLKSEITSLQETAFSRGLDEELLQSQVTEGEAEIKRLKELLEKEKKRGDAEKKKAEAEKKKAAEALKLLKAETSKLDGGKQLVDNDLIQKQVSDGVAEINRLKELLAKEKKRGDVEEKKAEAEKRKALEALKLLEAEKSKLDGEKQLIDKDLIQKQVSDKVAEINRLKELLAKEKKRGDSKKKKAETEKKKALESLKLLEAEKSLIDGEKKKVDMERNRAEELKTTLEALQSEASEARIKLATERSKNEEAQRKLEAEKNKANVEKKRADSEMAKAELQKRSAEEERKKLLNEKNRSDQLSRKLEEEKKRSEELERKVQDIMYTENLEKVRPEESDRQHETEQLEERLKNQQLQKVEFVSAREVENVNSEAANANVVFLEKQLELEKKHVKHTKKVAKFEKKRNNLLQQEICRLKQDLFQFCHRVNLLDGCFSHGDEGIDASAKISNRLCVLDTNLKGKLSGKKSCEMCCEGENEVLKAHHTTKDGCDHVGAALALYGGSCTKPLSGISSELESVMEGSARNKSQNSAIYSTTASFSDRTLVGSQGRGDFSLTTSPKVSEENKSKGPEFPIVSDKITTLNLGVVAENKITSQNGHDNVKIDGMSPSRSRKRKRSRDTVESIKFMSDDNKLLKSIDGKLSTLHDMIVLNSNLAPAPKSIVSEDGRCQISTSEDDQYDNNHRTKRKKKLLEEQADVQQIGNKAIEMHGFVKDCTQAFSNVNQFSESVDAIRTNENDISWFENLAGVDFMKLLDLDDAADEERYRMAMERPQSPTLPEINWGYFEECEKDNCSPEQGLSSVLDKTVGNVLPSCSLNVIRMEIDSDILKSRNSESHDLSLMHPNVSSCKTKTLLMNNDGLHSATELRETSACQVMVSTAETPLVQHTSIPESTVLCASDGGSTCKIISKYIVCPDTKAESSISRIISASEACISKVSMVPKTDWVVDKILFALSMEQGLLPKERACTFFSLLLYNFSLILSTKYRNFLSEEFSVCSASFMEHMQTVMCDSETKHMLLELWEMDAVPRLIQDFLTDREVLLYNKLSHEQFASRDSGSVVTLSVNGINLGVSSNTATIEQLVIVSIGVASISAAIGDVGFVCEVSYDIIQKHKSDSHFSLTVLHVFASICGKQYFTSDGYSLMMTVIKSIVVLLEKGDERASESQPRFPQCAHCIFSEDAVPVDKVMSFLLKKLHSYYLSGGLSNSDASGAFRGEQCPEDELCLESYSDVNGISYSANDYLSLVELVSHYMSWKWTCSNTIPRLLQMLDSCVSEEFTTAVLLLLGQLRRLGDHNSGEQIGVEEDVRRTLSSFLDQNSKRKCGLPIQFAATHALIGLLSIEFEDIIQGKELPANCYSDVIRNWFSNLSEEKKSLPISLLKSANVHE